MTDCKWPHKKAYRYEAEAVLDRRRLRENGGSPGLVVYQCPAGHWHVGNRDRFAKLDERIPPRRGTNRRTRRGRG